MREPVPPRRVMRLVLPAVSRAQSLADLRVGKLRVMVLKPLRRITTCIGDTLRV